ncbi:unnamed protein product [Parnassius mnemosyne]|uniref:Uncharacterized protein n=1 Tax=Parnassius mnemosyne TaxID=213953 RepID=A0AAV1K4D6_9NEOP
MEPHASVSNDPRASLIRHYSDDIPDVSLSEIRMALQHLKNGKAPGEDGITAELLKAGGKPVLEVLQKLFNSVLHGGITPEAEKPNDTFFNKRIFYNYLNVVCL